MKSSRIVCLAIAIVLQIFIIISCRKESPIYKDWVHDPGEKYIQDSPDINTIQISSLEDLDRTKISTIKMSMSSGTKNRIDLTLGSKQLKFVVEKYKNITIYDSGSEILLAVGYLNNYLKNRAYIIVTNSGELYAYYILDNIFYILKKANNGKYSIIDRNQMEDQRYSIDGQRMIKQYTDKDPIEVSPDFFDDSLMQSKGSKMSTGNKARNGKLDKFLNVVINVSGNYASNYPGSLYDSIYAMCNSFYSAFLTKEDGGLDLDIKIYIYRDKSDNIPWSDNSEVYIKTWRDMADNLYPSFNTEASNTIFVRMHLDRSWDDGGSTIGRAYVTKVGLGRFVIVGYANIFYLGALQTLAHEVGHSLGAVHADSVYEKYNTKVYDVMQTYSGMLDNISRPKYREDHLYQGNIRRILSNWR